MPKQLSDKEVGGIIDDLIIKLDASSIKDMGRIMGVLKEEYAGQIDMNRAGGVAKQKLG